MDFFEKTLRQTDIYTGRIIHVQCGYLEHLRALAVGGGYHRGMDIHKVVLLEKFVHAEGRRGADSESRAE